MITWARSTLDVRPLRAPRHLMHLPPLVLLLCARAQYSVVPADDKKNMRLIVSQLILNEMRKLDMNYPIVTDERRAELQEIRKQLIED